MADKRETLSSKENFYNILHTLYHTNEEASILYDYNGITRANGNIKQLSEPCESAYLILDDNSRINIRSIVAVNGIFAADYSEC